MQIRNKNSGFLEYLVHATLIRIKEKVYYLKKGEPYRLVDVEIIYPDGEKEISLARLPESLSVCYPNELEIGKIVKLFIQTEGEFAGRARIEPIIDKPKPVNKEVEEKKVGCGIMLLIGCAVILVGFFLNALYKGLDGVDIPWYLNIILTIGGFFILAVFISDKK